MIRVSNPSVPGSETKRPETGSPLDSLPTPPVESGTQAARAGTPARTHHRIACPPMPRRMHFGAMVNKT